MINLGDKYFVVISGYLVTRVSYNLLEVLSSISSLEAIHLGSDTTVNIVSNSSPTPGAIVFNDSYSQAVGISVTITGFLIK